jgi:hypothetical protein
MEVPDTPRGASVDPKTITVSIPTSFELLRPDGTPNRKGLRDAFGQVLGISIDEDGMLVENAAVQAVQEEGIEFDDQDSWYKRYFDPSRLIPELRGLDEDVIARIPLNLSVADMDPEEFKNLFAGIGQGTAEEQDAALLGVFQTIYGDQFENVDDLIDMKRKKIGAPTQQGHEDSVLHILGNAFGEPDLGQNYNQTSLLGTIEKAWKAYQDGLGPGPSGAPREVEPLDPLSDGYSDFWSSKPFVQEREAIKRVLVSEAMARVANNRVEQNAQKDYAVLRESRSSMTGSPLMNATRWQQDLLRLGENGFQEFAEKLSRLPNGEGYRLLYEALLFD